MTAQPPSPADDDALAEALADAWVERARHHPEARRLALQAAGLRKPPAEMTVGELAERHQVSRRALNYIVLGALAKLRHNPEIRGISTSLKTDP